MEALIYSGSEVNGMIPGCAYKLDLISRSPNIGIQKIDSSYQQTYDMVSAGFWLHDR